MLCALVLTVTIEVLWRTSGVSAAVIFTFVVVNMAIVSPTPFVDPVWNNSFGFFWFIGFLGVAFAVGRGHLRLVPFLFFLGSVAIDSNLLYLPTIALLLAMATITGWLLRRPANYRWLCWTGVVAAVCWVGPLYQQFFDARPNLSILLHPTSKTEGWVFGFRALSRASAINPIWTAPRPIDELAANADIVHRSVLLGVVVLFVLVGVAVQAWRYKKSALLSLSVVTLGTAVGVVALFSRTPSSDLLAFIWVNLAVWILGIGIWLTLGLAVFTVLRPQLVEIRSQVTEVRSQLGRKESRVSGSARRSLVLVALGVACLVGVLVAMFPYGNQFLVDFPGVARVKQITADIQHRVPPGKVGIGLIYRGPDFYQVPQDEHGVAYLLLASGWTPGLEPQTDQLLGLPIDNKSPFVAFTEQGARITHSTYYPTYQPYWFKTST